MAAVAAERVAERKLRRVPAEGWVAGVCAGIGRYADVDKMVVRALYVLGTLVTLVVPGTLAYVIMWAVIPPEEAHQPSKTGSGHGRA